jgi:hypothetical protein
LKRIAVISAEHMIFKMYKLVIRFTLYIVLVLSFSCVFQIKAEEKVSGSTPKHQKNQAVDNSSGVVTGKVSFGPLRPGPERVDETGNKEEQKEILQKMYSSHKVTVLRSDGKKIIREVEIDKTGTFKVELPPAVYLLQVTPAVGRFQKAPVTVEVKAGKTVTADISVDTGIR